MRLIARCRYVDGQVDMGTNGSVSTFTWAAGFTVGLTADTDSAYHVAERIRQEVASLALTKSTGVTASIGISSCPSDGVLPTDLISAADTALYHAKYSGGNRVHISSSMLPTADVHQVDAGEARSPSLAAIYALSTAVDAKDHYTYPSGDGIREGSKRNLADALMGSSAWYLWWD